MAAETLLREVEDKRKRTLDHLDSEYATRINDLKRHAESDKLNIQENARKQAQEQVQREKIRIEGAAKLQGKKLIFDATEKMLEANLGELRRTLGEWVSSKDYQELLPRMVKYASKRLGGEIRIICRQDDAAALKRWGAEIVSSDLNSIGGFKAEKKDGTLELDLTFEEILRSREEEVRRSILGSE